MHDKQFPAEKWQRLMSEERQQNQDVNKFLATAQPNSQEIWLDFGCGPGYFTLPLARKVKKVIAADISEQMLAICQQRLHQENIANVECLKIDQVKLPLNNQSVDKIILVNVLHELEPAGDYLSEFHRVLKPGGELFVIDWKAEAMEMGPPLHHRLSEDKVKELLNASHFNFVGAWEIYAHHYTLRFHKTG